MGDSRNPPQPTPDTPRFSLVVHPLQVRKLSVVALHHPTPRVLRVRLGGDALAGFQSLAPDDHVKVLFPKSGCKDPVLPEVRNGQVLWQSAGADLVARDYTPLNFDARSSTLELEIVLHGGGRASNWGASAQVGDVLGVAGPRGSHVLSSPPARLLLIGDDAAVPAVGRWLSELPSTTHVTVYLHVSQKSEERLLPTAAQAQVHWFFGTDPELASERLASVLQQSPPNPLPDLAWIAGEAGMVQRLRATLKTTCALPAERIRARGYWKLGHRDHQEPHED